MKQAVRTRIAPSPTGEDLHIGSVYNALFNYVFAKKHNGAFIVRIEDTDRERFVKGAESRMLDSLDWVGIPRDEDVRIGGKFGPYRQSERLPLYKKYADELVQKNAAYYCFCSSERLSKLRNEQQKQDQPPMYDGLCKKIRFEDALERVEKEKYVIRLNMPDTGNTVFTDLVHGKISFQNQLIDDQILIKSDGFPTYHLAVVVDDHLMQISHIIRGEEWISSTPKHIVLYQKFGWSIPKFAHLPLLRNKDKSKLSKRRNSVWMSWFRNEGFLPEAILNYLGTLTWSMPDERDIFSLSDMIKNFKLEDVKTTAPIFDIEKLAWLNGQYIRALSTSELSRRIQDYISKVIDPKLIKQIVPLAKERMKKLSEFHNYLKPFIAYQVPQLNGEQKAIVEKFIQAFQQLLSWKKTQLEKESKKLINKEGLSMREAFMALRIAVTGEKIGLPLFETLEILGKEEFLMRLKRVS